MDVATIHYEALKKYLARHLAREQANGTRTNAREKLTKLTKQQFQELSTDVYDELSRRLLDTNEVPFLPVKDEFHPKRNQARQKLATLPQNRFKDLASDVYYELERRYPELKDMDFPSLRSNNPSPQPQNKISPDGLRSQSSKPNNIVPEMSTLRQETISEYQIQRQNNRPPDTQNDYDGANQKPYNINTNPNNVNNTGNANNYPPVPDSVPPDYGSPRSTRSRTQSTTSSVSDFGRRYANGMSVSSVSSVNTPNRDTVSSQNKPTDFASLDSLMADLGDLFDRRPAGSASSSPKQQQPQGPFPHAEVEKVKIDYELRVANLQKRIKDLESELSAKGNNTVNDSARVKELEKQLEEQKQINKQQTSKMTELEREFDKLAEDHHQQQEIANDVQKEANGLLDEIKEISKRNDELYAEKETDSAKIKSLTKEVNEWKSKYEKAKTELRNFKATSTYFSTPKYDVLNNNSLAPTPDGAIEESKIISYQVAIDELLKAGRSDQPTNVLMAMKSTVLACKGITEEVDNYEQRKSALMNAEEKSNLDVCKAKLSATLKNLTTAAKNHATGYGISPVSLLDAAASHLTASVVDLVKVVKLRRDRGQNDTHNPGSLPFNIPTEPLPTNNLTAPLRPNRSQDEMTPGINGNKVIDIDELKDFLERQTEAIVQAIHTLLQVIRGTTYSGVGDLNDNINTITTIVLTVISVCHDSFKSPAGASYQTRGDVVLKELENNVDKLDEMKDLIARDSMDFMSNKNSKQRLASASFEIAKFTKELVSLVKKDGE